MIATENISFAPAHIVPGTVEPALIMSSLTRIPIIVPEIMNNIDSSAKYHQPSCATLPKNIPRNGPSSVYSGRIPRSFQGMNRSTINTNETMNTEMAAFCLPFAGVSSELDRDAIHASVSAFISLLNDFSGFALTNAAYPVTKQATAAVKITHQINLKIIALSANPSIPASLTPPMAAPIENGFTIDIANPVVVPSKITSSPVTASNPAIHRAGTIITNSAIVSSCIP